MSSSCPVKTATSGLYQYNLIISVVCVFFWMTAMLLTGRWAFLPFVAVTATAMIVLGMDYTKRKGGKIVDCKEGYYFGVMLLPLWLSIALFILLVVLRQAYRLEMIHSMADKYIMGGMRSRQPRRRGSRR